LSCGPVQCAHFSVYCAPKIYLAQYLHYYALTTVVEMEATLDSFSLFLCPNPALLFIAVSVCLIYNNVSARVSLDQALLGEFLSVL
jgi:hypothetical protein